MKWKYVQSVLCVFFLSIIAACSGGDGGGSSTPVADGNPEGIWSGTFDEEGTTYEVSGLIHSGEIVAFSTDAGVVYKGTYSVAGDEITANMNCFESGGSFFATSVLNGTFSEQGHLNGTFTTSYVGNGTTQGTISLAFNQIYNRPSSLELVAGDWEVAYGDYSAQALIDDQGHITAEDTDGCIYAGVISVLDPNHNLYAVDVDVTDCYLAGQYGGFAMLDDKDAEYDNNTLIYGASSDTEIVFNWLFRSLPQ